MELQTAQANQLAGYLDHFEGLIGDKRTGITFSGIVKGIIDAGSLVCRQIAAHSPMVAAVKDGSQRVIRFVTGESTKRSEIDAAHLTGELCRRGVEQFGRSEATELWLIGDGSDLRKRYARAMPDLMQVRDLDGQLVPGYRTLNVIGVVPHQRGVLYHRLFSSKEKEFVSESQEVQQMLCTVSQAIAPLKGRMTASWILDSGFDDVAVWRTVWEQDEHVVCRIYHLDRLVEYPLGDGTWVEGDIESGRRRLRLMGQARTEMLVRRGTQKEAKRQTVTAEIRACPLRLTYDANVRREGVYQDAQKEVWLVEVRILGTTLEPWRLITDWPVTDLDSAVRIFRMYRQRWSAEDSFKFIKDMLGWEEVQLLDMNGIRTLVALGWIAAGFLYELGVTLEWEEVSFLARLGGWVPHKDRRPGKIILTRGLRRLLDMLITQTLVDRYVSEHGNLPAGIAALMGGPD